MRIKDVGDPGCSYFCFVFVKVETYLHLHAHKHSGRRSSLRCDLEEEIKHKEMKNNERRQVTSLRHRSKWQYQLQSSWAAVFYAELEALSAPLWLVAWPHQNWHKEKCNQCLAGSWCFVPSLVTTSAGRRRREEEVLRALPHADCQASSKEHVEQVFHFVRHLETEAFTYHHVPRAAELLVHGLLDHLCGTLGENMKKKKQHKICLSGELKNKTWAWYCYPCNVIKN